MQSPDRPHKISTLLLTLAALVAFAGNSILCRLALRGSEDQEIDPVGFTVVRLASGALFLFFLMRLTPGEKGQRALSHPKSLLGAATLFVYAICFSLAYANLDAGAGALILFGAVQFTMLGSGFLRGERTSWMGTLGIFLAIGGVAWLVAPGARAPEPTGSLLMSLAGLAWGLYSLLGRGEPNATQATARNFQASLPLCVAAFLLYRSDFSYTKSGLALACASGALTSGLGYVLWYRALRGHSRTSAAVVQLAVPAIAALGGVAILNEDLHRRLIASGTLTLGGIALALFAKPKR